MRGENRATKPDGVFALWWCDGPGFRRCYNKYRNLGSMIRRLGHAVTLVYNLRTKVVVVLLRDPVSLKDFGDQLRSDPQQPVAADDLWCRWGGGSERTGERRH
eukprot:COSAG03_NODE_4725_length_1455_cov_1.811947_2_plen_103_part_00